MLKLFENQITFGESFAKSDTIFTENGYKSWVWGQGKHTMVYFVYIFNYGLLWICVSIKWNF